MTRLRAEDLPKHVRDKLGLDVKGSGRRKKSRAGVGHSAPCAGTCVCGEPFDNYSAFERHARELGPGHHRWRITITVS
jgi:hypothetical protein